MCSSIMGAFAGAPSAAGACKVCGALPMEYARRALRHRAVIFVISDFAGPAPERALRLLAGRHDVIAVPLEAPQERVRAPAPQETIADVVGTLGQEVGISFPKQHVASRKCNGFLDEASCALSCATWPLRRVAQDKMVMTHVHVIRPRDRVGVK